MKCFPALRPGVAALFLLALSPASQAQENAYDVLGQVLAPFSRLVAGGARTPERALQMDLRVESAGHAAAVGQRASVALEMPDRLRITAPFRGEEITICRSGETIWAYPGAKLEALLASPAVKKELPKQDKSYRLGDFELPIPEKQLAFLPILFRVEDGGSQSLEGRRCRVLDVQLQKELAKSLEVEKSTARLWVAPGAQVVRVSARGELGEATVRVEQVRFSPALPATTWEPTAEQASDTLKLSPQRYDQIVRALLGRGGNRD